MFSCIVVHLCKQVYTTRFYYMMDCRYSKMNTAHRRQKKSGLTKKRGPTPWNPTAHTQYITKIMSVSLYFVISFGMEFDFLSHASYGT